MIDERQIASHEKKKVALISVFAAIFITCFKLFIGLLTHSLGILSEALHSGLDLAAAIITFFSVRISDKPADSDHNFGHGKIENFSAFIETILLLITCVWIVHEAVHRLITGKVRIEVNIWSYIVVLTSIIIDYSRSRALSKAAKTYNSQALEADALHFSTDIWSSTVVLIGLIFANFGYYLADSIAALFVAFIVIFVSFRLGKRAMDALLDRTPTTILTKIDAALKGIPEITNYHDIKVRTAGADTFIELNIHVKSKLTIKQSHEISHRVEKKLRDTIERCDVHVHTEPEMQE
ncbi:MAG: cation diffusion facilitator family transporter [Elusimicrobia bacterium]|nr:cation diffusion facilitator family transporter [Elusimicrobiota bacterium]